jgi:hypothetical protein
MLGVTENYSENDATEGMTPILEDNKAPPSPVILNEGLFISFQAKEVPSTRRGMPFKLTQDGEMAFVTCIIGCSSLVSEGGGGRRSEATFVSYGRKEQERAKSFSHVLL